MTDLAAVQSGDSVILTFALPKETVEGKPLKHFPQIEIFREFLPGLANVSPAAPAAAPSKLIFTIPSEMVGHYFERDRIRFPDPFPPAEVAEHAGGEAVYMVRTRTSKRAESADSNLASLRVFPAPKPVKNLRAKVTPSAIELSWAPAQMPASNALAPIAIRYRVYRAVAAPASAAPVSSGASSESASAALTLLVETPATSFRDTEFSFGQTYAYSVRSVAQYVTGSAESAGSKRLEITPRDTFPPAPPQGLAAAALPAAGSEPARVELSWAISQEADLAGYNIYRSQSESNLGNRLNAKLLLTPAFRDIRVLPGQRYFYRVTAVDRSGNESAPSAVIAVTVPEQGPSKRE